MVVMARPNARSTSLSSDSDLTLRIWRCSSFLRCGEEVGGGRGEGGELEGGGKGRGSRCRRVGREWEGEGGEKGESEGC